MEILPESDQSRVLEFMRLTPSEKKALKEAEPIRDKNEIRLMTEYFKERGEYRNYVLILGWSCFEILENADSVKNKQGHS